ncbi:MAG: hypothetical protein ACI9VM_000862 [Candidatus Azotimanducaceae bacterium]|jgi:hypothetical protein
MVVPLIAAAGAGAAVVARGVAAGSVRVAGAVGRGAASGSRGVRNSTVRKDPSHPTVSDRFVGQQQYGKRYAQREARTSEDKTDDDQQSNESTPRKVLKQLLTPQHVKRRKKLKKILLNLKARGVPTKGTAKKVRASGLIAACCWALYLVQIVFAVISIIGLAIYFNEFSLPDASVSTTIAVFLIPGEYVFFIGWIISSLAAVFQLIIALTIFYLNGVNALKGTGLESYILSLVGCALPLGIIPFGIIWWWGVMKK